MTYYFMCRAGRKTSLSHSLTNSSVSIFSRLQFGDYFQTTEDCDICEKSRTVLG